MNYVLDKKRATQKWIIDPYNADVHWFNTYFGPTIHKEGWYIKVNYDNTIEIFLSLLGDATIEQARQYAQDYGWILGDGRRIIGFDIDKLTRNRHLITGTDLGLL